jgi:hypothetical protein
MRHFSMGEIEDGFRMRNENVVQRREKSPEEEK